MGSKMESNSFTSNKAMDAYLGLESEKPKFTLTRTQSQPHHYYNNAPPPLNNFEHYPPPPPSPLSHRDIVHIPSKVGQKKQSKQTMIKSPKSSLDIELPLTPPFNAVGIGDADFLSLGLPQNLTYSKTTPCLTQQQNIKKTQKRKKNKKNIQPTQTAATQKIDRIGFNFANFDLNEKIKLINKEMIEFDQQMKQINFKTNKIKKNLFQIKEKKERILKSVKMERMILSSSTKQENDEQTIENFKDLHLKNLRSQIEKMKKKNMAVSASSDVTHKTLRFQIRNAMKKMAAIKGQRVNKRDKNIEFELSVIELNEMVNSLKERVESERHSNFLSLSKKLKAAQNECFNNCNDTKQQCIEYPPEQIVQNNLVCRQIEFYFSDYNLKRDKRLLEKICKEPQRGYLSVDEVLSLSRVRQLVNTPNALYDALKTSPFIHMIMQSMNDNNKNKNKQQKQKSNDEDNKEEEEEETATLNSNALSIR